MRSKIICAALAAFMLFSLAIPAFADEAAQPGYDDSYQMQYSGKESGAKLSEEATAILLSLKERFDIGDDYDEFNFSTDGSPAYPYFYFNWYAYDNSKYLNIMTDGYGNVIDYNTYGGSDWASPGDSRKQIPTVSRAQAAQAAADFLELVNPQSSLEYVFDPADVTLGSDAYVLYPAIYHDGLPIAGMSASISISAKTGVVVSFSAYMMHGGIKFPSKDGVISMEQAQAALVENVDMELWYIYGMGYTNTDKEVLPAYMSTLGYEQYVDALTGKLTYIPSYLWEGGYDGATEVAEETDSARGLTEYELEMMNTVEGLMSLEQAEAIARALPIEGFDDSFTLGTYSLSHGYSEDDDLYLWYIGFSKRDDAGYHSVYTVVDAVSGDVYSFDRYAPAGTDYDTDYGTALAAAQEFMQGYAPELLAQCELVSSINSYSGYYNDRYERFTYARVVNGIKSSIDVIALGYDYATGNICSYHSSKWLDADKYPASGALYDADKLLGEVLDKNPPALQYVLQYSEKGQTAHLVYAPDYYGMSGPYDAATGALLVAGDYSYGDQMYAYDDIDDLASRDMIVQLGEMGIGLAGGSLSPDKAILQKELMQLIYQSYSYYGTYGMSADDVADEVYTQLMARGIIRADEVAREAEVTREQAAVFVVRALGYEKIAEKRGIFMRPFPDIAMDTAGAGYIAIAKAMGLMTAAQDGKFLPAAALTRETALVTIYNYLLA